MSLSLYYLVIASVFLCQAAKQEPKDNPGSDSLPGDRNAIKTLTVKQAKELAKTRGLLYLNGLTNLSVEVAKELAKYEGYCLYLNGLTTLPVEVATELAKYEGYCLYLNGLTTLPVDVARELANNKVSLSLGGLTTLSVEVATELAQFKGEHLFLNGLATLSVEVAKKLAKRNRHLFLDGLKTLPVEVATGLAMSKGGLQLGGLTTLPVDVARELANNKVSLSLGGLTTLSVEVATELAQFKGEHLFLNGLATLSVEVAKKLAKRKGHLELRGLETLSPKAQAALEENSGIYFPKSLQASALKNIPKGKDSGQEADGNYPLRKLGWSTKKCMLCNALRNPSSTVMFSDRKGYGFCLDCGENADTVALTNENFKKGIPVSTATAALVKTHVESIQGLFPPNWKNNESDRAKGLLILTGFLKWREWEKTWENAIILGLKESDINR